MKVVFPVGLLVALCACAGCGGSVHPLWSDAVATSDDRIVGTWIAYDEPFGYTDGHLTIAADSAGGYTATVGTKASPEARTYFGRLVALKRATYLELRKKDELDLDSLNLHHVLRMKVENDKLFLANWNATMVQKTVQVHKAKLNWTMQGRRMILTSETRELQRFFEEYENRVLDRFQEWHRREMAERKQKSKR